MLDNQKYDELKSTGVLPSPKGAALKIIELCQRSNVSLPEIIHVIQADPGLTGRILKMANSPVFARARPVVSLSPDVLMSIGTQSLRQVVLAFSLVSANRNGHCRDFDYTGFWSKSVAMGVSAQLLGAAIRVAPPVEVFTCGLLAQVGQLALSAIHPDQYSEVLERARKQPDKSLSNLEEDAFGLTHTQVAAAMMADWGIPKLFTDAVLFHEMPETSNFPEDSRSARLVWCLNLARQMAESCFMDDAKRVEVQSRMLPAAQKLGIDPETLVAIGDQMLAEWKEWSALLEIAARDVTAFNELGLDEAAPIEAVASEPSDQSHDGSTQVLVVDDDQAVLLMLKKLLTNSGHQVYTAKNGTEALRLALELQPRILITDWLMPEMNGLQLIKALRETELGRGMYAIVLTALAESENLVDAFDAGADDFIVKPIDPVVLKARLKAGLRIIGVQQDIEREREALRRLAAELAIAHQHARENALTDSLTGLHNRRYAMERLSQEWMATERNRQPLSIMMLDIDHFKLINDTYGHDTGDAVLRHFAELLREFSRTPDVACRVGGEEFIVMAPNTTLEGAMHYAERIRAGIQAHAIEVSGVHLHLTVSVGVAQKSSAQANLDQLLKHADDALYRAKHEGRNRIVAAPLA
jgi:diguanylate cyclase (GGDEF)-like protein